MTCFQLCARMPTGAVKLANPRVLSCRRRRGGCPAHTQGSCAPDSLRARLALWSRACGVGHRTCHALQPCQLALRCDTYCGVYGGAHARTCPAQLTLEAASSWPKHQPGAGGKLEGVLTAHWQRDSPASSRQRAWRSPVAMGERVLFRSRELVAPPSASSLSWVHTCRASECAREQERDLIRD